MPNAPASPAVPPVPNARRLARVALLAAVAWLPQAARAQAAPAPADTGAFGRLPLVEVRPARPAAGGVLAVVLTGDGDWADLVRGVARTLADSGVGVVGLKARAYLTQRPRTPDQTADDVARIVRTYLARWGARRVALVGYSRGADMLPFLVTRLPADVRARVDVVAMFGLATRASFTFHWLDLVSDRARTGDLLVGPELVRAAAMLPGARFVCVYGTSETDSACRDASPGVVTQVVRTGAHHFDGDFPGLARVALDALRRPGAAGR